MATDKTFAKSILDRLRDAGCEGITAKPMFGEYGLYSDGKIFGSLSDNRLFIKPTGGGRTFIKDVVEAPPYPGAKPNFLIEHTVDPEWLCELVRITVQELPEPKPKKHK